MTRYEIFIYAFIQQMLSTGYSYSQTVEISKAYDELIREKYYHKELEI